MEVKRIVTNFYTIVLWQSDENLCELEKMAQLTESEYQYYSTLTHPTRKREWITSRYVIKLELGFDVSTIYSGRKPLLDGSDKHISISHSENMVSIIFSDTPCGIDIEDSSRNFERVYKRFLSQTEQQIIKGKDIARAWCVKEAAYKMIGRDDIDFATMFEIVEFDEKKSKSFMTYNNKMYEFNVFVFNNFVIACGII